MRPIAATSWLWPLALLLGQSAPAATQYFLIDAGTRTKAVENGCPVWIRETNHDDCTYNRSPPATPATTQWVGPVFSAGYYAPGTAPQVFQSTPPPAPVTAPAQDPALEAGLIGIPITSGFISIDDNGTAADRTDDRIGGTIEFGAFERNISTDLTNRAVESYDRIIHRLVPVTVSSPPSQNASGGFDYLVGATVAGVAGFPRVLNGFTGANGGFTDHFPSQVASQSSTDINDIPYWDDFGDFGIAAFEGANRLVGTPTAATAWGYSCKSGTGPGSCTAGGLLGGSDTQAGYENVLLRLSTDGSGNLTLAEAFLVNYSDLSTTVVGIDSWQATAVAFTGAATTLPLGFDNRVRLRSGIDDWVDANVLLNDLPGVAPVTVTILSLSQPADGTARVLTEADGVDAKNKIRYTPAAPNPPNGEQVIQYQITDANNATATATLHVNVFDDMPVTHPDTIDVEDGISARLDVVANDTGLSNSPILLEVTSPPTPGMTAHGIYFVNPGNPPDIRYTPNAGYTGPDTLTYRLTDHDGDVSGEAIVTLNVQDSEPMAVDDTVTADTGVQTTINVLGTPGAPGEDTGLADRPIVITITTPPGHGTATVVPAGGGFRSYVQYTSTAGFTGTDTFSYTLTDAEGDVSPQAATVTITVADMGPEADDDTFDGSARAFVAMHVLTGDTLGPDRPVTLEITQQPTLGTTRVTTTGTGLLAVQDIEYKSNTGATGSDTLKYRLHDSDGSVSNEATVTINVANDTPGAHDDPMHAIEDGTATFLNLLGDDTGIRNRPVTITITQQPSHGHVSVTAGSATSNPSATYTPDSGYTGDDSFRYSLRDADGDVSPTDALVPITVSDSTPQAEDENLDGSSREPIDIDVLAGNETLIDLPVTMQITQQPVLGTAELVTIDRQNGTHWPGISYKSNLHSAGTDTVKYTITDRDGDVSNVGTLTLEIVDGAPLANNDSGDDVGLISDEDILGVTSVDAELPTTLDVLRNDERIENAPLTINAPNVTAHGGTLTPVPADETKTGQPALRYQSSPGYVGPDSFSYTVTDADGEISNAADVSFEVVSIPFTRTDGEPEPLQTNMNTPVTVPVLANDGGLAFGPITVAIEGEPVNGTAVVNADNTITFTPTPGFSGQHPSFDCPFVTCQGASFRYSITDSYNQRAEGEALINVYPGAVVDTGGASTLDLELLGLFAATGIARRRLRRRVSSH